MGKSPLYNFMKKIISVVISILSVAVVLLVSASCASQTVTLQFYDETITLTPKLILGDAGIIEYEEGHLYVGKVLNNKPNGSGKMDFAGSTIISYEGEWRKSKPHGQGVLTWEGSYTVYTGGFVNGNLTGQGKITFSDGTSYEGGYKNGKWTGHGVYIFDGGRYEGDFLDSLWTGNGHLIYDDGLEYVGGFTGGVWSGEGRLTKPNGDIHEGTFAGGALVSGTITYANGMTQTVGK